MLTNIAKRADLNQGPDFNCQSQARMMFPLSGESGTVTTSWLLPHRVPNNKRRVGKDILNGEKYYRDTGRSGPICYGGSFSQNYKSHPCSEGSGSLNGSVALTPKWQYG